MFQDKEYDDTMFLVIEGIDYRREAEQLIRLFYDGKIEMFYRPNLSPGSSVTTVSDSLPADHFLQEKNDIFLPRDIITSINGRHYYVIKLQSEEMNNHFQTYATVFLNNEQIIHEARSFVLSDRVSPSDIFFQSKKLCMGNTLYSALVKIFQQSLPWGSLTGVRPTKLASCCLDVKMSDKDIISSLVDRTAMNKKNAERLLTIAHKEQPYRTPPEKTISLYIGIPFCASRCTYCSFTSYSIKQYGHLIPQYIEALTKEIQFLGDWMDKKGFSFSTIYMGGGTPTALPVSYLESLLINMNTYLPITSALEYTIEAGRPDTIDESKLSILKKRGAMRISINPQSMHQQTLDRIGRNHTAEQVERAFAMAKFVGLTNCNADIIAGLPGETAEMFKATLQWILALAPKSLTVHTMAIKRASRLYENIQEAAFVNDLEPKKDKRASEHLHRFDFKSSGISGFQTTDHDIETMVEYASDYASNYGYEPYYLYRQKNIRANLENVGYAQPGYECRYNIETMSEQQTIIALGSGGITKVSQLGKNLERVCNVRDLHHYIDRIDEMIERKKELLDRHYS